MKRRVITAVLAALAVAGPAALSQAADTAADTDHGNGANRWSYDGSTGPQHWSGLSADFVQCASGQMQSPINLVGDEPAVLEPLDIDYHPVPLKARHNGHTILLDVGDNNSIFINGTVHWLVNVHLHSPSEHAIDGRSFDLELHLVHENAAGNLVVLGVLVAPGEGDAALDGLWSHLPLEAGAQVADATVTVPLGAILPAEKRYVRYTGSLTTPPCTEGVTWIVFKTPLGTPTLDIHRAQAILGHNARPLQARGKRMLLGSGE